MIERHEYKSETADISYKNERSSRPESIYADEYKQTNWEHPSINKEGESYGRIENATESFNPLYGFDKRFSENAENEVTSDVKEFNSLLKEDIAKAPDLAAKFTNEQVKMIDADVTPRGCSWHYDVDSGKVQLVKTSDLESKRDIRGDIPERIKDVVDQNVQEFHLPSINGHWTDASQRGNSMWIPDDNAEFTWKKGSQWHHMSYGELKAHYGIEGVVYRNKEPDFAPFEDSVLGHVEVSKMADNRSKTYADAYEQILQRSDCPFNTRQEIIDYMQQKGLTWHECSDRKTIRAIPTEINAAFPHSGGISTEKSVQAIRKAIGTEYGQVSLSKDGIQGVTKSSELAEARSSVQHMYRSYKK